MLTTLGISADMETAAISIKSKAILEVRELELSIAIASSESARIWKSKTEKILRAEYGGESLTLSRDLESHSE